MEKIDRKKLIRKSNGRIIRRKFLDLIKNPYLLIPLIILTLKCIYILFELYWFVITSFKSPSEFRTDILGFPSVFRWENFTNVLNNFRVKVSTGNQIVFIGIAEQFFYTLYYCFVGAVVKVLVPCTVAYAVSKFPYKFNIVLIGTYWIMRLMPVVGTGAASLKLFSAFGLYNNIWLFTIVSNFSYTGNAFLIFIAVFSGVSNTYREAAAIDGASEIIIFFKIILPQVFNVFVILAFSSFAGNWDNYTTPMLYFPAYPTLSVGIYHLSTTVSGAFSNITTKFAGFLMLSIPIVAVYWMNRKKILGKVSMGGLKE